MPNLNKNKFIVLQSDTPDFDGAFEIGEFDDRKQAKRRMMEQAHVDLTSNIYLYYCVIEQRTLDVFPNVSQDKPQTKPKTKIQKI